MAGISITYITDFAHKIAFSPIVFFNREMYEICITYN